MKNRLKTLLFVIAISPALLFVVPQPVSAAFNPLDKACQGQAAESPACQQAQNQGTTDPIAGPDGILSKAANVIALVAGIGAVIMILIGGFEFVSAGGTGFKSAVAGAAPTRVAKARSRIASGLIGLVVVALAWAVVRLITDKVLG